MDGKGPIREGYSSGDPHVSALFHEDFTEYRRVHGLPGELGPVLERIREEDFREWVLGADLLRRLGEAPVRELGAPGLPERAIREQRVLVDSRSAVVVVGSKTPSFSSSRAI